MPLKTEYICTRQGSCPHNKEESNYKFKLRSINMRTEI